MTRTIVPNSWAPAHEIISSPKRNKAAERGTVVELAAVRQAKTRTDRRAVGSLGARLLAAAKTIAVDVLAGLGAHAPVYSEYNCPTFPESAVRREADAK
jgi:hypothetical protein